jgi:hypothetical protein
MTPSRACDGCTFCCWSFGIDDVPYHGLVRKSPLTDCWHACHTCGVHDHPDYPKQCRSFICPYLSGDDIHRPDSFEYMLKIMRVTVEGFIPAIPVALDPVEACNLVYETRSMLASMIVRGQWQRSVISLDSPDGVPRMASPTLTLRWISLLAAHGIVYDLVEAPQ